MHLQGTEARDALLGQLFGYGCIARSGIVTSLEEITELTSRVVKLANQKSFLREAASAVLLDLAERLNDDQLKVMVDEDGLKGWLTAPAADSNAEVS